MAGKRRGKKEKFSGQRYTHEEVKASRERGRQNHLFAKKAKALAERLMKGITK